MDELVLFNRYVVTDGFINLLCTGGASDQIGLCKILKSSLHAQQVWEQMQGDSLSLGKSTLNVLVSSQMEPTTNDCYLVAHTGIVHLDQTLKSWLAVLSCCNGPHTYYNEM